MLHYLKGTLDFGILYWKGGDEKLESYTDSDYASDVDDRKSTSGYVFLTSSGVVSWLSKKHVIVTLSTTEAEFVAAASTATQAVWLRSILEYLNQAQSGEHTIILLW